MELALMAGRAFVPLLGEAQVAIFRILDLLVIMEQQFVMAMENVLILLFASATWVGEDQRVN
jgi:hypothetical protein